MTMIICVIVAPSHLVAFLFIRETGLSSFQFSKHAPIAICTARTPLLQHLEACLCLQPPRFSLHHYPHLPPPTPQMKSPPRATSARLNDHPSRGSMKEALEGELELGSPENRRCSSTREAAKASTESVLANTLPLQYARPGLLFFNICSPPNFKKKMKLKQSSNRVRIIVNVKQRSMPMSPATTFLLHHYPTFLSYAADEISTEIRYTSRGSMKEALEGELELGHQRTVVVAPPEKAAKASTSQRSMPMSPATTFLPPPLHREKSPPRATSARLNDHPSRGSMKEALEGELELGSPENRRCSSTREGG
uniref:Uncharacterized protein n=1 Tax=Salix viminalis TaxID=40686 RepID=A0A6N2KYT5_SALVM